MKKIRAALVGISGYAGMELARLLAAHPAIQLVMACSRAEAGKNLARFYPFLRDLPGGDVEITVYDPEKTARACDVAFLAVPAGTAMDMAPALLASGLKVVDFSADFRLMNPETYQEWYKAQHAVPELLTRAVYGLPELNASQIRGASLVANPGCYPTAAILGLYAALKHGLVNTDDIIIDAKSGASGAGRKGAVSTLFCEISDNFRAYGLPRHRHTPEIEQELSKIAQADLRLDFTPHIVPMKRGIFITAYASLRDPGLALEKIWQIYHDEWANQPWVRVLPPGELPETANVRGSMFCDIGLIKNERTGKLLVLSVIDNLCRGASGQALANANLMCGLVMQTGLEHLAPMP